MKDGGQVTGLNTSPTLASDCANLASVLATLIHRNCSSKRSAQGRRALCLSAHAGQRSPKNDRTATTTTTSPTM